MEKIAYEKMGQRINDWYKIIKQNDIPKAIEMRDKIKENLPHMEENQDVLIYFNLIDSRYKLMIEKYNESGKLLADIKPETLEAKTDNMIQYYFYFFSGMYEYYKKNFTKAINFYRIAENRLIKIEDEIEKAEFHYQIAIAYYEIRQYFFSLNHAEKALDSYKAYESYANRVLKCKMIIAANQVELERYEEAEKLYKYVLNAASSNGDLLTESFASFNLGVCYERRELLSEAKRFFERAASIHESENSVFGIRSMYMLSRVNYKLNLPEEARKWYSKSLERAVEEDDSVYKAKLKLIYSLYDQRDLLTIENALEYLKNKKLWADVADLTFNIAIFYKKQGDSDIAAKYFEEACRAKDQILKLTGEL
ncbi:tetratricopeptide repeat protein [Bacillus glycinifermentans]|uniref:Tetratricopeptide repeat protein n=2 Tax=Bacillus glycinifermentans TaxID=1664069 RepID=A0ABU6GY33_9BACI|nr:tetratricopeptide repeat protein [Bacillus glycinifermentans]MEC0483354.1 tetratricopeptide repeat protein [Bacillus glycinifermentans]MEC0493777.1 tetratricopeptide repeat protein [Bacillus glycinifermentans]MEC0541878.1 tetratricopeptide repeat protein [Bacillus glycinifermentans]